MKSIKGTQTELNIALAFIGESQARTRYEFFSKRAKKDGFVAASKVFLEIAEQERSHAKSFYRLLEGRELNVQANFQLGRLGSTRENLRDSVILKKRDHEIIYPEYAKVARDEELEQIAVLFSAVANAEGHHLVKLQSLLSRLETDSVLERKKPVRWVCSKCGYVHNGTNPLETCPACQHGREYFEVDDVQYEHQPNFIEDREMNSDEFVRACEIDALNDKHPFVVSIMAKKVGVFKRADGSVYAIELVCKHQGADLSRGEMRNGVVVCQRHGWSYSLSTGECLSHPGGLPLKQHDIKVENGTVFVSLMPMTGSKR